MIKSGYSFRTAYGHLPDVMSRLVEVGYPAAPLADRLSTFGFTRWTKLAKAAGLKPVYGVEIPCVTELGAKKPITDMFRFLARDSLRPLSDIVAVATSNPGREPTLLYRQAFAAQGLVKIGGERLLTGALPDPLPDQFYGALAPSTPKGLVAAMAARGLPLVALSDNLYPRESDKEFYRVALGRRATTQTYPLHILSDDEWRAATAWIASPEQQAAALANRDAILAGCNATMKTAKLLVPEKRATLRAMCEAGAAAKNVDLNDPVYAERLERELRLIDEKEFGDYFYILADLIGWARQHMVVGPARGSSCGSLVCYLLDITTIDPIPYGLIFERFIDINRKDLPDIDVDFSDTSRHLVFEYAEARYGTDHVARLGTVGLFKPRSALKQAGAALHIPGWRTDKVLDSIIERSSGDSRAMNAMEDTLNDTEAGRDILREYPEIMVAARLEGHPNNASQHAAGVVITDEPVGEYVVVDARTKAAWCDKKDSEDLNLLKIDALGLTQLSIFERALELIDKPLRFLEKVPLDDPAAFAVLNAGHFAGIFQFTGVAMRSLAGQIKYSGLSDVVATTALARPGPLATGGANAWVKRKAGHEPPTTIHPMLTELTKETYGVIIFQEQVMRVVREMGWMSWEDTSAIRKAMSGRLGEEFFNRYWVKFRDGALKNNVDENTAKAIWDNINSFGSWAFNQSHAVAYGIVSYWCCWLKAHHPVEFAAATLDAESDPGKQVALLRELADEGVDYVPVDPAVSTERWEISRRGANGQAVLVGPLTAIKGIGPKKVREILDTRARGEELRPTLLKQLMNAKTDVDSLFPIAAAVKRLHPDLRTINIFTEPVAVASVQPGVKGEVMILALAKRIAWRDENDPQNVAKRGYALKGPTQALNMFFADDTDEVFCKINRYDFERIGRKVMNEGRAGKSLYAIKGTIPSDFRMISVKNIRYLGEIDR